MSEKRRPDARIVAEIRGKRLVCELFSERQWGFTPDDNCGRPRYRIRQNGRWVGGRKKRFFSITKVTVALRRWMSR
jgi:hypothetical protein